MNLRDMKYVVNLLENEWNLGSKESGTSRHLCAWIYLMEILEETEKFVYYRENGRLLGIAGYSKNSSKKNMLRKKIYSYIKNRLYKSKEIKDLNALKEYEDNYYYVPEEFKNHFDGEVSILILDKNKRGKGIGEKMLSQVFDLAKKDNMKNLQILTDESCSYGIYEKLGCKKVYETTVLNKEHNSNSSNKEQAFIYEKIL